MFSGGESIVEAELILLKRAIQDNNDYYHLISGNCLPIKSQNFIHEFFKKHEGKEFITYQGKLSEKDIDRIKYYHFFIKSIGKSKTMVQKILKLISFSLVLIQKSLGINRIKHKKVMKGDNWFSVTHDFAKYVVSKEMEILENYKLTKISDEFYMQTLLENSHFKNNRYMNPSIREIIWGNDKTSPNIFTINDFELLKNSEKIFARKFDENKDKIIIDEIYNLVRKNI